MAYLVKTGHGVAFLSLVAMAPQPRTDVTIRPIQRSYSASGAVHETGPHIELLWSMLETATEYTTLLAQFGLSATVLNANVTVYVPNSVYTFARYNGVAHLPLQGSDIKRTDYFIRDVIILVKNLVAL